MDYLAANQTLTQVYTVTISDGSVGGTVTQDVFAEELAIIREAKQRELAEAVIERMSRLIDASVLQALLQAAGPVHDARQARSQHAQQHPDAVEQEHWRKRQLDRMSDVGDGHLRERGNHGRTSASSVAAASSRSAAVFTSGPGGWNASSIRMPIPFSRARNCSSFSMRSRQDGARADNRRSADTR